MKIKGVVKGLSITLNKFFKKKVTELYPDVMPNLPERSRGSFDFIPEKCISCNICATACPNGVIRVDAHKGDDGKKVLDQYNMSLGYCLYCGLCVEACPTKALLFNNKFENAVFMKENMNACWKGKPKAAVKTEENGETKPEAKADAKTEVKAEVKAEASEAKSEIAAAKSEIAAAKAEASAAKSEIAAAKAEVKAEAKAKEEESV